MLTPPPKTGGSGRHVASAQGGGSSDDGRRVAARVRLQRRELHCDGRQRLDNFEGVPAEVAGRIGILLKVQADRRAGDAGAGEPENDAGAVRENEAEALVLRHAQVHGVAVLEDVIDGDLHALDGLADEVTRVVGHQLHHLLRLWLVNALVVVPGVIVAAVLLPMRVGDVLDAHQLSRGAGLGRDDLHPGEHGPHAVFLADVVAACAERFFATDERRVGLAIWEVMSATVHQIAEKLPAGGNLEASQALLLRDQVQGAGRRHGPGAALEAANLGELRDAIGVGHDDGQGVRRRHEELRAEDHVPVGVAIGTSAKAWHKLGGADLLALGVETHPPHQVDRIGEVGIGVPMPG
mmetsp:Transcript_39095/g.99270  ORF Transcript_39095/g.99270 Transcript_39095/m.99270 type:complete len:351 (-) Transcript_39095:1085-2137(-)